MGYGHVPTLAPPLCATTQFTVVMDTHSWYITEWLFCMKRSIISPEYRQVLEKLVQMRTDAGKSQRDLARLLGREHSFVWRIETGKRRLDVVEFYWVCQALGRNAAEVYGELFKAITALNKSVHGRH